MSYSPPATHNNFEQKCAFRDNPSNNTDAQYSYVYMLLNENPYAIAANGVSHEWSTPPSPCHTRTKSCWSSPTLASPAASPAAVAGGATEGRSGYVLACVQGKCVGGSAIVVMVVAIVNMSVAFVSSQKQKLLLGLNLGRGCVCVYREGVCVCV